MTTDLTWNDVGTQYGSFVDEVFILGPKLNELFNELDYRNTKIIDIACGTGIYSRVLANYFKCKVEAIDYSENMIAVAKQQPGNLDINYSVGDSRSLPYQDGMFAGGLISTLLTNLEKIEDIKKTLSEAYRVLSNEGKLIITIPHPCFEHLSFEGSRTRIVGDDYKYFKNGYPYTLRLQKEDGTEIEVRNYHWTLETYINSAIESRFKIKKIIEPQPIDNKMIDQNKFSVYLVLVLEK